jgi:DNA-binding MurR/RpiR family transcriptional regulator
VNSLRVLAERTPEKDLAHAVRLLAAARQVYAIAQGRSFPVAYYLAFALGRLERRCQLLDGVGGVLREQADLAETTDAVLAVSFRPYTPLVIDVVSGLAKKRVPIVAITDSPLSPLAQAATVSFHIREDSDRVFKSLIAPMCLAQALAVALGHHLAGSSTGRGTAKRGKRK